MVRHTTDEDEGDGNDTATDDGTVDAHTLSEGDRVEVEATPMRADESGRVTGDVVDATVHTMNDDEVGKSATFQSDTGNRYVRKGTGTLSVVDDDGFRVTIAWESTLRREPATDGGDDIIVAGDEGVILTDDEDDDTDDAHPDDEGVEILPDGGGSEPTPDDLADLSDGDVVEVDTHDGDTLTLTVNNPRHPNLGGQLGNGQYIRYFERDDGKRVSIRACHDDKNDARRHDASYLITRTKTGGIFDNIDTDKREVVAMCRVETDGSGGKPPAESVSIAPNYDAGGVWFTLGDLPRTLLSPDDARSVADHVEGLFRPTPDGYDNVDDMADRLRDLADDVEETVDDPDVAAFDDIPLTARKDGADQRPGTRTARGP